MTPRGQAYLQLVHSFNVFTDRRVFNICLVSGDQRNIIGRPPPDGPDFDRWRTWVHDCANLHSSCRAADNVQLPTRVLDVSTIAEHGSIRLVESQGRRGRYVTLSHAWGDQPTIVTTPSNYTENAEAYRSRTYHPLSPML